jgi:hypothetical protein
VRKIVDSVGPKLFKNFDKMRLIMFDPAISQRDGDHRDDLKKSLKKSYSDKALAGKKNPLTKKMGSGELRKGSMHTNLQQKDDMMSNDSFELPNTIYSDVDLSYLDELELNRAFSVFKNI